MFLLSCIVLGADLVELMSPVRKLFQRAYAQMELSAPPFEREIMFFFLGRVFYLLLCVVHRVHV